MKYYDFKATTNRNKKVAHVVVIDIPPFIHVVVIDISPLIHVVVIDIPLSYMLS